MSWTDLDRLRADASGNTGLSAALEEAVSGFCGPRDVRTFLASRGFDISDAALHGAAQHPPAEGEGGYGALMRYLADHRRAHRRA